MTEKQRQSATRFDAVSFSGCGTLNFYQTGVAAELQERGLLDNVVYGGTSAGSGLATLLCAGVDAKAIGETAIAILAPHAGKNILTRPRVLFEFADRFLDAFVDEQTAVHATGRVHISITRLKPLSNWSVDQFFDTKDLCRAIRASCHLPSVKHPYVRFRGRACVDGGFTCNTPSVGERCLRVSPFLLGRNIDIRPSRFVGPQRGIIVPTPSQARQLFQLGKTDARAYLESR